MGDTSPHMVTSMIPHTQQAQRTMNRRNKIMLMHVV